MLGGIEYFDTFVHDYFGNKTEEKTAFAHQDYPGLPYASKWEYDYAGRVVKQYNAFGDYASFQYDALGQLVSQADYASNASSTPYYTTFEYDALGRRIRELVPFEEISGTVYYGETVYYYDRNGNLTGEKHASNRAGQPAEYRRTEYAYDSRNHLTFVTVHPETSVSETTAYTYDQAGNLETMTVGQAVTVHDYDVRGRLVSRTDPLGQEETYVYDTNGNLLQKTDRNGSVTTYSYDGLGRLLSSEVETPDGLGDAYVEITYTLTGQKRSEENDSVSILYTYDAMGRLATETSGTTVKTYGYNLADSRTSFTLSLGGTQYFNTIYTYDEMNRMVGMTEGSVSTEYGCQGVRYLTVTMILSLRAHVFWVAMVNPTASDQSYAYLFM